MKKTLKRLLIFMGVFMALLVGGIGGYGIIMNNKTYYVYDIRFVEPIANARGYIYTNEKTKYKPMTERKVYLQGEDYMEIAVFVSTSNGSKNIEISTSDSSIARIEYRYDKCYVKFLKAGLVSIKTKMGPISDSLEVEVFDKIPSGFRVYDYSYYGEGYADHEEYVNRLVCYSNTKGELSHEYDYKLFDEMGIEDEQYFNSGLLEIDESSYDKDYFSELSLDKDNRKLKIVCKEGLTESRHTTVAIKSYYLVDGKKYLDDVFEIDVFIIANEIEFVQIEVSTNPDFTDKIVCLNIPYVKYSSDLTNEQLISYLTCHRVEEKLKENNENATYNIYLSEKTPELYMKFRLVYTNGTLKELNKSNLNSQYSLFVAGNQTWEGDYIYLDGTKQNYLQAESLGNYFVLKVTKYYLENMLSNNINLFFSFPVGVVGDNLLASTELKGFRFEYLDFSDINDVKKLYKLNEDGTYSYNYWDERLIYKDVVYDENGNIVEFF